MKFRIYEKILNEIVGSPPEKMLTEVDATSHFEAKKLADRMFPNHGQIRIESDTASVDY